MIDLSAEIPISLREAAQQAPVPPHQSTLDRWWRRGVRGVRLETFLVGGRRFTTRAAMLRFIEATTAASLSGEVAKTKPASSPCQRADRAANQLEEILTPMRRRD